ncbi:ubiquinol oxidase subunit II [Sandaracinobacter neustonicus]|uniref:Ubiquinol oxidase polypeptide II n=1 Tax=Sandaracinobacter neustonicus TaxID=1715348 RepID=A0A501XWT7_9SPHN|nr:ubiquinol oxidase subunit II [Sandaracinobacter neustonicus]TPE65061.1 ubiquinol oxidase subunit II [Sandaracinobacter neustonicus]
MSHSSRLARRITPVLLLTPLLSACDMIVLNPAGDVAQQQGDLVVISTLLMLLIIVPVMALTIFFAWKYRADNKEARYEPEWSHSTQLELAIWGAPLLIIICLGALTWVGTHLLDPYRPLARTAPGQPVAADVRPLEVQVVALDWKWLFIYPEQGIATVNELVAPVDRPIRFRISSSSVMNSFYVPALAGQIYAMPAMETKLHAVFNRPGNFRGFSANYSGAGFSGMRFDARGLSNADFDSWVETVRGTAVTLDRAAYLKLEQPSENVPVTHFGQVERGLFDAVVNLCVEPGKMCQHDMMAIDAKGGLGLAGAYNVAQLSHDKFAARGTDGARPARFMVAAMCDTRPVPSHEFELPDPVNLAPLIGAGLALRAGAVSAALSPIPSRF